MVKITEIHSTPTWPVKLVWKKITFSGRSSTLWNECKTVKPLCLLIVDAWGLSQNIDLWWVNCYWKIRSPLRASVFLGREEYPVPTFPSRRSRNCHRSPRQTHQCRFEGLLPLGKDKDWPNGGRSGFTVKRVGEVTWRSSTMNWISKFQWDTFHDRKRGAMMWWRLMAGSPHPPVRVTGIKYDHPPIPTLRFCNLLENSCAKTWMSNTAFFCPTNFQEFQDDSNSI